MMNICLLSNDNYVVYIETLIVSILKNSNDDDIYHFHIIEDDISIESKNKINNLKKIKDFKIDFYTIPVENKEKYKKWVEYLKNTRQHSWNHIVWYKLDILFLFKDLDNILFIDADSIVMDNISTIFQKDYNDYYCMVQNFRHTGIKKLSPKVYKWLKELDNDHTDEAPYYLSGTAILFNLKKIREEISEEKLKQQIDECFNNYKDIIFTEEHIFMYLFRDKILYEDMYLDYGSSSKVGIVSMYFSESIGKPISKDFDRDINEYFYKFWKYFAETESFKENIDKYLELYYQIRNKKDPIGLLNKINHLINKIVWYIPIKKVRDNTRKKIKDYLGL